MTKKFAIFMWAVVAATAVSAQSAYPGLFEEKFEVDGQIPLAAECLELRDVRLLPGRFHDNLERDSAWMVSIGVERLLHCFHATAGVYNGREGGYMTVKKLGG